MRNPTIWESAGRPLFVRSVWLEGERSQRQRHFILDYDERGEQQDMRRRQMAEAALRPSLSCDFAYAATSEMSTTSSSAEELRLIGSAKVPLQQPPPPLHQQTARLLAAQQRSAGRRASLLPAKAQRDSAAGGRGAPELCDLVSRRSSVQDLQSTLAHGSDSGGGASSADERLAERVLNWLDLAGKADYLRPPAEEAPQPASARATRKEPLGRRSAQSALVRTAQPVKRTQLQRAGSTRRRTLNSAAPGKTRPKPAAGSACALRRPDSMKHNHVTITSIIFDREGVPVRLNRPARNIDLCTLASSAGATRRWAGALASARLYKGGTEGAGGSTTARRQQTPRSECERQAKRQLHDEFGGGGAPTPRGLHDARKQLHIFMPSLPKKGALAASLMGGARPPTADEGAALSGSFSELCKL